jgi:epoxyqueuosine reductase
MVCPWNRFAHLSSEQDFQPRQRLDDVTLIELFAWSEQAFLERMQGSAIRRIGYECWLRNIAVALGNANSTPEVIDALQSRRADPSPLVREHVQWALKQHKVSI